MRFADTGGWTLDANAFSDSADALGEAEIGNGRPDIGMRDGMKGGSLFLNGYNGADKAVFSAAGTYSNAETGKVVFDSVSFYRGTIVFDLAEEKKPGDFTQINGTVTKSSESSELSVEINVSANLSPRPRTLRNRRHARACRARLRRAQKTGKINICFNKKPGKTEFPRLFCASKTAAFKGGERPINRRDSLYALNADFQTPISASPSASGARRKAVFYRRLPPNGKRPARFALTKSAAAEHAKPSISAHSAGSGMETIQ